MGELLTTRVQTAARRISDRLRITLDAVRALAATYVVIHHVVVTSSMTGPLTYMFRFGQEAVMVFFLLSGFLIFASEQTSVRSNLRGYYLRRLRRIYPLLLAAMAVTASVVWANGAFAHDFSVVQLALNLLSLQDVSALKPGVITDPFMGNSPLWSLSYEVFFYLVFPLVMVVRRVSRPLALAAVGTTSLVGYGSFLLYPNHLSLIAAYLLVWWAGATVADLYRSDRLTLRNMLPVVAWLTVLCGAALVGVFLFGRSDVGVFPLLPLRHFAFALVCVVLAGTGLAKWIVGAAQPFARPAAYVASISYGLYVFHYPLLIQWQATRTPIGFAVAALLLLIISVLGDRLLDRIMPRPTRG